MSDETVEDLVDPLSVFPSQMHLPVQGLAYLGQLSKEVSFCGHTFTIKSLRPGERAAAALVARKWRNTLVEPEVWANAQVALALVSVDGDEEFCPPLGPDLDSFAEARLRFITNATNGYHQITLDFLFEHCVALEKEVIDAVEALRNLSERNRNPSQPSADSLTDQGTSNELTDSVSQP